MTIRLTSWRTEDRLLQLNSNDTLQRLCQVYCKYSELRGWNHVLLPDPIWAPFQLQSTLKSELKLVSTRQGRMQDYFWEVRTSKNWGWGVPPRKLITFDPFCKRHCGNFGGFSWFCYFFLPFFSIFSDWLFGVVCRTPSHPLAYAQAGPQLNLVQTKISSIASIKMYLNTFRNKTVG